MELRGRTIALYGRFSPGVSERVRSEIAGRRGVALRDLTRRSDLLVVGALATTLVDNGALPARLRAARERVVPVMSERGFLAALAGEAHPTAATLPISTALSGTTLTHADVAILAAFDLVETRGEDCRFGDARVIRTAADLVAHGRSLAEAVRILTEARDLSPLGRHKIITTSSGEAALEWQDGNLTTLAGQGYLPLDADHPSLDDLFERAALAEASGDLDAAARLYDQCARADRTDAIAPYNLGNIRLAEGDHNAAALAYQRALARDRRLAEARYNLAQALEAAGKPREAAAELTRLLALDTTHADAVFNLAQLRMNAGEMAAAKALYERYLAMGPPEAWASLAKKAILVCSARQSA
jgi:predicted TPR repeat methyltransferase